MNYISTLYNVPRTLVGHVSKWATNSYMFTLKIDYSTTTG
jgi:hypothetical protein